MTVAVFKIKEKSSEGVLQCSLQSDLYGEAAADLCIAGRANGLEVAETEI